MIRIHKRYRSGAQHLEIVHGFRHLLHILKGWRNICGVSLELGTCRKRIK